MRRRKMLVRNFLTKCAPGVSVRVFDLDALTGNHVKEDEACVLNEAYRFDYNSEVTDFYICSDIITIYSRRRSN